MDNSKRLEELLNNVSDGYTDFVEGISFSARKHNFTDRLIKFIEEHPDANSSEIIERATELLGIRKVSLQETSQAAK